MAGLTWAGLWSFVFGGTNAWHCGFGGKKAFFDKLCILSFLGGEHVAALFICEWGDVLRDLEATLRLGKVIL